MNIKKIKLSPIFRKRDERLTLPVLVPQLHIQLACKLTQFVNELVRGYIQNSQFNYIAWAGAARLGGRGGWGAVTGGSCNHACRTDPTL